MLGIGMGENRTGVLFVGGSREEGLVRGRSVSFLVVSGMVRCVCVTVVVAVGVEVSISDSVSVILFCFIFICVGDVWCVFLGLVSSGALADVRRTALKAHLQLASIRETQRDSAVSYCIGDVLGEVGKSNHPYPIFYMLKSLFFQGQSYFGSVKFSVALHPIQSGIAWEIHVMKTAHQSICNLTSAGQSNVR